MSFVIVENPNEEAKKEERKNRLLQDKVSTQTGKIEDLARENEKKRILDKKKKNEQKWEITKNGKGNEKKIEKGKWQREKNRESRHPIRNDGQFFYYQLVV